MHIQSNNPNNPSNANNHEQLNSPATTIGIIGFGSMAAYHFEQLKDHPDLLFKGIYDLDPRRMAAGVDLGLHPYSSAADLLADPTLHMVLVATTNDAHREIVVAALEAGKHVLCEKPVALTSEDLEVMIATATRTGNLFSVNQNRRTNKDFALMKRCVDQGLLGEVYRIESRVEGSRGMPKGWRTLKDLGGGMLYDWGVHLIDQILFMQNDLVTSVYCQLLNLEYPEVDDNFHLQLTFESGLVAQIEVATNNYIPHPRWYVLGTQGSLQIEDWDCSGQLVRVLDPNQSWEHEIVYTKAGPTKTMAPRRPESIETIKLHEPLELIDHLSVVYENFTKAIKGEEALAITPSQALRVLKVMEAAFLASKTKQIIHCCI